MYWSNFWGALRRDGVSLSNQKQIKPVVTASQIMMLGDLEAYLKFPQNLPVAKVKFDYSNIASQTVGFVQKTTKPRILKPQAEPLETESTADSALPIIAPIPMPVEDLVDQKMATTGNQTNHQSTLLSPEINADQPKIPPINLML